MSCSSSLQSCPRRPWRRLQVRPLFQGSDLDFFRCGFKRLTAVLLADELEKRKRVRQKKLREEKRREKRIEMEENKKQGKCKRRCHTPDHTPESLHSPVEPRLTQIPRFTSAWRTCSISQRSGLLPTTAAPQRSQTSRWTPPRLWAAALPLVSCLPGHSLVGAAVSSFLPNLLFL